LDLPIAQSPLLLSLNKGQDPKETTRRKKSEKSYGKNRLCIGWPFHLLLTDFGRGNF
jgi:hypothetical protein